jgi:hypothetical protein
LAFSPAGSTSGLPGISGGQASSLDRTKGAGQNASTIPDCNPDWAVVSTPNYCQRYYLKGIAAAPATVPAEQQQFFMFMGKGGAGDSDADSHSQRLRAFHSWYFEAADIRPKA